MIQFEVWCRPYKEDGKAKFEPAHTLLGSLDESFSSMEEAEKALEQVISIYQFGSYIEEYYIISRQVSRWSIRSHKKIKKSIIYEDVEK